jgi:HD-GYP domain-containing protein (c-di-GMP phosphodiesterase class II)
MTTGGPASDGRPLRLADLLSSMSLVADLGFGLPPEEAMRACVVATALARRMGLGSADVRDAYYTTLLEHLGCNGFAHEVAMVYGDELVANAAAARTNVADARDGIVTFLPAATRGRPPLARARIALFTVTRGSEFDRQLATAACEVGRTTARRLGLGESIQRALDEVFEAWNGTGPRRLRGDAIALASRFARLGATVARFDTLGGREAAVGAVKRRAGSMLDPALVATFVAHADDLVATMDAGDPQVAVLAAEPAPTVTVPAARLADVAAAFGDIGDLKSPFMHGHSSGVARLARDAGEALALGPVTVDRLHVAGLLHDLGRVATSDAVWESTGPPTTAGWERIRLHAYHSERILARSTVLGPMAEVVGMHHERLDGSGYHRGAGATAIPMSARVLGAADAYQAMTQDRAFRPAIPAEVAAERLRADAQAGRLDADAAAAVLEAAGHGRTRMRTAAPAGLSEREIEVLRAMAQGLGNREIARQFSISPRTAEHHVQHIYAKIGVSSRAAAALFAMEHDLLGR